MLLWFCGMSFLIVWNVFHDGRIDQRLVMLAAVVPDLIDGPTGRLVAHAVVAPMALLAITVVATIGRRGLRRRLLAVPIGWLLHLVLDGVFNNTKVFWYPLAGGRSSGRLPSFERSGVLTAVFEAAGGLALWWGYRRFGLGSPARRSLFLRTGQLDPAGLAVDRRE